MTLKLYLLLCEQIFVVHTFKGRDKKFVESPKSKEKVKAYSNSYKVAHYRCNPDLVTASQLLFQLWEMKVTMGKANGEE